MGRSLSVVTTAPVGQVECKRLGSTEFHFSRIKSGFALEGGTGKLVDA